ncbi:hypothetical protein AGABI1DRAFT_125829 [Agaricus bisporus var. burnettii JB137-S8]|uniref:Uncharacterized protein n=1 Tax=Agaricus bisporus var. burnettii (strain JB137-S8 / ATCC MYA-4627 / FGSC 10392) TaxID=597362 RepID=K5XDM7_AGABU|nr:uncharacterized protein AGABI1DRAFT_125829 [Agaricus bisporus var. burnettii JB137-S8]EKM81443.1 hypothetical protein AGABI1DRAFT_125829 [Agaricus bisporus var. burnettii JB137-S8]
MLEQIIGGIIGECMEEFWGDFRDSLVPVKPFLHFYFRNYRHLYTVEDMFTGSFDEEEESRKEAQVMKKVANFCARRHYELIGQKMTLDDYFPVLEEELKPEWI